MGLTIGENTGMREGASAAYRVESQRMPSFGDGEMAL